MRQHPHLRGRLTHCRDCGIFFFTHPCNGGRRDLRCPFGCRESHRKESSARRSAAYYRKNPDEKRRHNQNRYRAGVVRERKTEKEEGASEKVRPIVRYVRLVTSLIEGRWVSLEETEEMLSRIWRQRGLTRRRKVDYVVWQLNRGPP